jgi:predicted  nucleic acid-binding Zn-ribbon protein
MAHQCTDCGRTFEDGSTEMLSGCPDCGGTTFQYKPGGADPRPDPDAEPPEPPEPPVESSVARTVGSAANTVREFVGSDPEPRPQREESESGPSGDPADPSPDAARAPEDSAQASARSDVVAREDLPPAPEPSDRPTPVLDENSESPEPADNPDLQTLREELNDQFESIKVLEPGQYELNLMELYDREEYIIALQEDGKYTIQVPERWKDA